MNRKQVSVIIPVYNLEKHIQKTLESVIVQTYDDIEIIVIDDGSTDNSLDCCERILSASERKYKLIKVNNGGVSKARNIGIKEATGEYIFFLDGDDLINSTCIEKLISKFTDEIDFVFCGVDIVSEKMDINHRYLDSYKYLNHIVNNNEMLVKILNEEVFISCISGMYLKRNIINNDLFFTEKCINGEDQEFYLKYIIKARKSASVNESLCYYIQRKNSISHIGNTKKMQAVSAIKRVIIYAKKQRINSDILNLMREKITKEFFTNYNSLLKSEGNQKYINIILKNKQIFKEFPLISIRTESLSSIIFGIRINLFIKFPVLYTKIFRCLYKCK